MGAVFRALDTTLDRVVAVKVLAGRQADDEEMLRRFRNEAQSAARLDHENIGRVHAVGSENGWHYIVLEYIEGRNVRDMVREDGPFDIARTVDVAIQVADALEHASQRAVVHRDIKPSNIVITPAGRARIVDMGLARLHQMAGDRDLTISGMTLGTFDYISPERHVIRGWPTCAAISTPSAARCFSCSPGGHRSPTARWCRNSCNTSRSRRHRSRNSVPTSPVGWRRSWRG